MTTILEETNQKVLSEFIARTGRSAGLDKKARAYLPGGDTRTTVYYAPYPVYMERGEGCRLYDCDGNEYLDFLNNYTSLIHGHAHPAVTRAAQAEMEKGAIFGAPAEIQFVHAEHLCRRIPGLDSIRYCNSGTEATMFALRAARAFTGRDLIVKMDGGYHGSHDVAEVNLTPDLETSGMPRPQVEWGGPGLHHGGRPGRPLQRSGGHGRAFVRPSEPGGRGYCGTGHGSRRPAESGPGLSGRFEGADRTVRRPARFR